MIVAGDLNQLCTEFLERDFGLEQLVNNPTHSSNIIDNFFAVGQICTQQLCLINTKHQAVLITDTCQVLTITTVGSINVHKKVSILDTIDFYIDKLQ